MEDEFRSYIVVVNQEHWHQSIFYALDPRGFAALRRIHSSGNAFEVQRSLQHTSRLLERIILRDTQFPALSEGTVQIACGNYYYKTLPSNLHDSAVSSIKSFLDGLAKKV